MRSAPAPRWLSVLDENMDDTMELSQLPVLQGLLERMEAQAGRVVANELKAMVEEAPRVGCRHQSRLSPADVLV